MPTLTRLFAGLCTLLLACSVSATSVAAATAADGDPHYEQVVFHSAALQRDMRLNVYLPPHYDAKLRYPVLYFLHGKGGNEYQVLNHLAIGDLADELIGNHEIKPLIIVAPELDTSFGLNLSDNDHTLLADGQRAGRYHDYLVEDVPNYVEHHWAARTDRAGRMIGGFSMGGYAALLAAFRHPARYGKVGAHSPAINPAYVGGALSPLPTSRDDRDPSWLARSAKLDGMKIWIDCGQDDLLYTSAHQLAQQLQQQGQQVQWSTGPGGHNNRYWTEDRLVDYLKFYGN